MKKRLHLIIGTVLTIMTFSPVLQADTVINSSKYSTSISPEVIYRKAFIDLNKNSVYYDDDYANYADQLYLSLKLSKTFNYVNEVVLDPTFRTQKSNPTQTEFLISQAYIHSFLNNNIFITFGKKLEFEGSGFFINPSDLMNERKDLYDPLLQKEGQFISRIGYQGSFLTASLSFRPKRGEDLESSTLLAKAYMSIWDIDTTIQYSINKKNKSTVGLSLNRFWSDYIETHIDSRFQLRQRDINEERERPFSSLQEDDPSIFLLAGLRGVLSSKRSIVLEYIFKQSGLDKDQTKEFLLKDKADKKTKKPSVSSSIIGKQYVFLGYNDEDSIKKVKISLSSLYNIFDQSTFINPEINYTLSPIVSLSVSYMCNLGSSYTEFGENYLKNVGYFTVKGTF